MTRSTIGVDYERTGRASHGLGAVLRLLPPALVGALVALVVLFAFGPMAATAQAFGYSAEEVAFVKLINDYRASNGLQPLLVSDALSEAGDRHSSDMGKYRFFDHYTQASDWFARVPLPGIVWRPVATPTTRTRARTSPRATLRLPQVFTGWKNSSGHNANMLKAASRSSGCRS